MIEAVQAVAASAATQSPQGTTRAAETDFVQMLDDMNTAAKDAVVDVQNYVSGETMPIHELMIQLETSRLQLQLAVEIRNKLVEAYQELSRMQV